MIIAYSRILSAFSTKTIGTKIVDGVKFGKALSPAVNDFEFNEQGQGVIPLTCFDAVSCGEARREGLKTTDFVIRSHRGEITLFAKRQHAARTNFLKAIVYTIDAYIADPQVGQEEKNWLKTIVATHVLVAVIASAAPNSPLTSMRFVRNLAGGNLAYRSENGYTLDAAIAEAKIITEYEKEWVTVAD